MFCLYVCNNKLSAALVHVSPYCMRKSVLHSTDNTFLLHVNMLPATENLENPHSKEASKQTFLGQSPELVEQAGHVGLMHCCKTFCTKTKHSCRRAGCWLSLQFKRLSLMNASTSSIRTLPRKHLWCKAFQMLCLCLFRCSSRRRGFVCWG
jgi:hypothetical protein